MKYQVFSTFDIKGENFGMPMFFAAKGEAIRAFDDEANRPDSMINKHGGDFTLYHIGEFDSANGVMIPLKPSPLGTGADYQRKPERPADVQQVIDNLVKPGED